MSTVLFTGQHFHLYQCAAYGHYHILSRQGLVSRPCWSRAALIGLIRELRLTPPDGLDELDQIDALFDLTEIMEAVNALARKRNRIGGKFAHGFVLPHDFLPGEHQVAGPWQRFRHGETTSMSFPANDACGGIMVPLFCDFVGRDMIPAPGQSFREPEWAQYADAPARIIHHAELDIEWHTLEDD